MQSDAETGVWVDFDYDGIVSQSVLEYELETAKTAKNQDLVEQLDMAMVLLETNITTRMMTLETYMKSLVQKVEDYKKTIAGAATPAALSAKLRKHVELMEAELASAPQEEEEAAVPEAAVSLPVVEERQAAPPAVDSEDVIPDPALTHERLLASDAMYRFCYGQLMELKQAFDYLRKNGLTDRMEVIMHKAEEYQKVINDFRSGLHPSAPMRPLCPKDLFGMLESERLSKLTELTGAVGKLAEFYKSKALDALKVREQEEAARWKSKMVTYEKHSKLLKDMKKNPWQPLPKVGSERIQETVRVMNEDVPENVLRITIGTVLGAVDKESYYVTCALTLAGGEHRFRTPVVSNVAKVGFNHIETVQIEQNQLQTLERRRFTVELFQGKGVSQGAQTMKLNELADHCTCPCTIPLGRRTNLSIKVTFALRKALSGTEVNTTTTQQMVIVSCPPPFKRTDGSLYAPEPVVSAPAEESKVPVRMDPQPAPQISLQRNLPPDTGAAPAVSEITPAELADPNVLDNLNCDSVLEEENKRLMALIPKLRSEGKDVSKLIEQQRAVARKFAVIRNQIQSGVISPEEYREVLLQSIAHDGKLEKLFQERKQSEKAGIVTRRLAAMRQELQEMAEMQ